MYIFKNLIYFKMKGKGNRPIYFTKGKVTDKHNIKKYQLWDEKFKCKR